MDGCNAGCAVNSRAMPQTDHALHGKIHINIGDRCSNIRNRPRTVSDISSHGGVGFAQHEDLYSNLGRKV